MAKSYQVNTASTAAGEAREPVYTAADLDKIDAQLLLIAQGKSVAEYEVAGRKIKYRDNPVTELQLLRKTIERQINAAAGKSSRLRYSVVTTSKGL